jgi:spore coat protein A
VPGAKGLNLLDCSTTLDPGLVRYVHDAGQGQGHKEHVLPDGHKHRFIALTEFPAGNLYFRELEAVTPMPTRPSALPAETPIIAITGTDGATTWYRTAAMAFHDAVRIMIPYQSWEVWHVLNLTGDSHPIHVHLVQFQVLDRQDFDATVYISEAGATKPGQPIDLSGQFGPPTDPGIPFPPDPNEQGFKDTVRVNPGQVTSIAAHFNGFCGRYMYHCHILEHEDMDMMRPFIVSPCDALTIMQDMGMSEVSGGMAGMAGMAMGGMNCDQIVDPVDETAP